MTEPRDARQRFLETVRARLNRDERSALTPLPEVPLRSLGNIDLVGEFQRQARATGAACEILASDDIGDTLASQVKKRSATRVALSDSSVLTGILPQLRAVVRVIDPEAPREELFEADVGVSAVQCGIAETGTLVLESSTERNRLASLVPPTHIALLPASRIIGTMTEALAQIGRSATPNQVVTFITGPSRTADIELTLVVGVHGPRQLDIFVIRDQ